LDALCTQVRVIAPDLPGFGSSHAVEGTVTMSEFADGLVGLLDAMSISEPVHYCGLSMGGYIGWEFWRRHSIRLKSLIQADTRAVADTEQVARARQMMAGMVVVNGAESVANTMLEKLFAPETHQRLPEVVEATRSVMAGTDPQAIAAAQRGMSERSDFSDLISQIDVPSLLICGEFDVISPPDEMKSIADGMPNASFVAIEQAGHLPPLENPPSFNDAVLSFLAKL
ncbi:MAG: alpha/beta fold hydrolase, partial [Planctomycetota bacterium]